MQLSSSTQDTGKITDGPVHLSSGTQNPGKRTDGPVQLSSGTQNPGKRTDGPVHLSKCNQKTGKKKKKMNMCTCQVVLKTLQKIYFEDLHDDGKVKSI